MESKLVTVGIKAPAGLLTIQGPWISTAVKDNITRNEAFGRQLFEAAANLSRVLGATKIDFHVVGWNPVKEFYRILTLFNQN